MRNNIAKNVTYRELLGSNVLVDFAVSVQPVSEIKTGVRPVKPADIDLVAVEEDLEMLKPAPVKNIQAEHYLSEMEWANLVQQFRHLSEIDKDFHFSTKVWVDINVNCGIDDFVMADPRIRSTIGLDLHSIEAYDLALLNVKCGDYVQSLYDKVDKLRTYVLKLAEKYDVDPVDLWDDVYEYSN